MPTIAEQLTQLASDREDLVDNLTTKGITGLTGDETFTELVPEVLNISGGGGGADLSEYYTETISSGSYGNAAILQSIKKTPPFTVVSDLSYAFYNARNLEIIEELDTGNNAMPFTGTFQNCTKLREISFLNIPNVTGLEYAFDGCRSLLSIPILNTNNATGMSYAFRYCTTITTIPQLNTSNVKYFSNSFWGCTSLETMPQLDASSVLSMDSTFYGCDKLKVLGGFTNLGQAYLTTKSANYSSYTLILSVSSEITHDSLMNVINNLYDIATKGCKTQRLTIGSKNLAKLTAEEIATATSKGWSIS